LNMEYPTTITTRKLDYVVLYVNPLKYFSIASESL
jgi:hypothetical protein